MKLYSYNQHSESAKALAEALGIKRIKHEGKPFKLGNHVLLNWGATEVNRDIAFGDDFVMLNTCPAVRRAVNKLTTFECLAQDGVRIPEFTEDAGVAMDWLEEGITTVARTKLTGHSGEGIFIAHGLDDNLPVAPLYTQYIKKTQEYRCHVMHGEVFFVQRKARKLEVEDEKVNWQVRNLAGGFIYANQDVELPELAKEQAIMAVQALGLDFGAVDIIYGTDKKYYVLEVNTACGLAGTTLDKYVEQFKRYVQA